MISNDEIIIGLLKEILIEVKNQSNTITPFTPVIGGSTFICTGNCNDCTATCASRSQITYTTNKTGTGTQ